jgi:hypothetical protein
LDAFENLQYRGLFSSAYFLLTRSTCQSHLVMNLFRVLFILLLVTHAFGQDNDTLRKDSVTIKSFQFHMGFDWYYAINPGESKATKIPFFVSFAQNRALQQNLIYADIKWDRKRFRAHVVPALGTFMEQNSSAEKGIFRNLLEANIGVKPYKSRDIWLDAGILGSPYTNENPFSQEHLTLTRSLAAEYVPYYLAGARASWQINRYWKTCLFLLNGWQQIKDVNTAKSLGTQIEYKPNIRDVFNWNTYIGKEGISGQLNYGTRYFTDIFWTHGFTERFSLASCAFAGIQKNSTTTDVWWQGNIALRFSTHKFGSLSIRSEYVHDPKNVVVAQQIPGNGFQSYAHSVGYAYHLLKSMLLRLEYRRLQSARGYLFLTSDGVPQSHIDLFTTALTFWF